MNFQGKLSLFVLACVFLHLSSGKEGNKCEVCGENSAAYCIDESSYYYCMNGKPMMTTLKKCEEGFVCTDSKSICVDKSEKVPECSTSCNKCPPEEDGNPYTCVSKTEFGRCINNEIVGVESCDKGSVCSVEMLEHGNICAPLCVMDFFKLSPTCKNQQHITTTVAPPPAPSVNDLINQCKTSNGFRGKDKIYHIANENDCKTYIYCEKINNKEVDAVLMRCVKGYYNESAKKCTDDASVCTTSTL